MRLSLQRFDAVDLVGTLVLSFLGSGGSRLGSSSLRAFPFPFSARPPFTPNVEAPKSVLSFDFVVDLVPIPTVVILASPFMDPVEVRLGEATLRKEF